MSGLKEFRCKLTLSHAWGRRIDTVVSYSILDFRASCNLMTADYPRVSSLVVRVPMGKQWVRYRRWYDGDLVTEEERWHPMSVPTTDGNANVGVKLEIERQHTSKVSRTIFDGLLTGVNEDTSTDSIEMEASHRLNQLQSVPSSPAVYSSYQHMSASLFFPNGDTTGDEELIQDVVNGTKGLNDVLSHYLATTAKLYEDHASEYIPSQVLDYMKDLAGGDIHFIGDDILNTYYSDTNDRQSVAHKLWELISPINMLEAIQQGQRQPSVLNVLLNVLQRFEAGISLTPRRIYLAPLKGLHPGGPHSKIDGDDVIIETVATEDNSLMAGGMRIGGIQVNGSKERHVWDLIGAGDGRGEILYTLAGWEEDKQLGRIKQLSLPKWIPYTDDDDSDEGKEAVEHFAWLRYLEGLLQNRFFDFSVPFEFNTMIRPGTAIELEVDGNSPLAHLLLSKTNPSTNFAIRDIKDACSVVGRVQNAVVEGRATGEVREGRDQIGFQSSLSLSTQYICNYTLSKGIFDSRLSGRDFGMSGHLFCADEFTGGSFTSRDW